MSKQLKFGELKVALICWLELPASDADNKLLSFTVEAVKKKCSLYETQRGKHLVTIIPHSIVGQRFFCITSYTNKKECLNLEESKEAFKKMEASSVEAIKDFFSKNLPGTPIWIYFYPIWYIFRTSPNYKRINELEKELALASTELLFMDLTELQEIYPLEVTTPEVAIETLPAWNIFFDQYKRREAAIIVGRGLSLVVGASENFFSWFNQTVLIRIEPRPYVSFGDFVPRQAESIKSFPVFHHIQLTSGKGWIDNMIVLDEALYQYASLSKFSEMEEKVKNDIFLALSGIMVTLTLGLLVVKRSVFLLVFVFLFVMNTLLFVSSRWSENKFPIASRKLLTWATYSLYLILSGFLFFLLLSFVFKVF